MSSKTGPRYIVRCRACKKVVEVHTFDDPRNDMSWDGDESKLKDTIDDMGWCVPCNNRWLGLLSEKQQEDKELEEDEDFMQVYGLWDYSRPRQTTSYNANGTLKPWVKVPKVGQCLEPTGCNEAHARLCKLCGKCKKCCKCENRLEEP